MIESSRNFDHNGLWNYGIEHEKTLMETTQSTDENNTLKNNTLDMEWIQEPPQTTLILSIVECKNKGRFT